MRYLFLLAALVSAQTADLTPMLYNGTWQVTRKGSATPETLVNQCSRAGVFTTCAQTVNGGPGSLLVFIPRTGKPGQYYTQNIRPEGRATSRGDLSIEGNTWTFLSSWNEVGKTTYYKTVNTFLTRTHIRYEQSESSNNKDWTVTNSGEETRAPLPRAR